MQDLNDIKQIRKKLGLTQTELAQKSGVSQSLIAKIEAGNLDPTYTKTKRIFDTLNLLAQRKSMKAGAVMNRRLLSAGPPDALSRVARRMRRHGISQLPVIERDRVVGLVTEALLLEAMLDRGPESRVDEVMDPAPPTVSGETDTEAVAGLLKHFPMVLVMGKGRVRGLITKSDILESYLK